MCNLNQNQELEVQLLGLGLNLIGMAILADLRENTPIPDVLKSATQAYQQGKITKAQFMGVINALDEPTTTVKTTARVETPGERWNAEYLAANKFLNQYRG